MPFRYYFLVVLVLVAPFIITFVTYQICRKAAVLPGGESQPACKGQRRTYFYPTRELDGDGSYILPPSYSATFHDQGNAEHAAKGDERY